MKTPKHIAIIMDGNRRWAKKHGLFAVQGHKRGVDTLREIVRYCGEIKLNFLTVYAFSTENKKRSKLEVNALFSILAKALEAELAELNKSNVKLSFMGQLNELPKNLYKKILLAQNYLNKNTGLNLVVALNYGGKREIVEAARKSKNITEESISKNLYLPNVPSPDMIIRTGDVFRISNFLLWQGAYSELHFSPKLWPDFNKNDMKKAILDYNRRERRFGK